MLDRAYCSAEEILEKCRTCLRNDKHRLKAVEVSDRNYTIMTVAKPIRRGSEEMCDMFLTRTKTNKEETNG